MDDQTLVDRLRDGFRILGDLADQGTVTEADTRQQLIDPLIEWLRYDSSRIRLENLDQGNKPDYLLYAAPIPSASPAQVVVEAKPLDTDFDRTNAADRTETPHRQAIRYLRDHAASGPSTMGALTDGIRWRIYRKDAAGSVVVAEEIDVRPLAAGQSDQTEALDRLRDALARGSRGRSGSAGERALRALASAIRDGDMEVALSALSATSDPFDPLDPSTLGGRDRDQVIEDWEAHVHADGPEIELTEGEQGSFEPPRARLAAVRFQYSDHGIGREDAARCARIFAARSPSRIAVTFVWQADSAGRVLSRIAVALNRNVAMTQPFDPELAPPAAREAAGRVMRLLTSDAISGQTLLDALDVLPLQRDFYTNVRAWIRNVRRQAAAFGEVPDNERHEVLLRHLIRVLFVWILKEGRGIPPSLFEARLPQEHGIDDYHTGVLRFLFHERLNTQSLDRRPHPNAAVDREFARVPFLNGSLFEERPGDSELRLAEDAYWQPEDGTDTLGLFDILARYHWTADEQRPGEREQTLDPELLSNLFEQLIADPLLEERDIRGSTETLKAPDGAYYTPMDVAAEMAADALAAAVRPQWPAAMDDGALLELFRDPEAAPSIARLSEQARGRLIRRIEELRIFDPAVGSGAFLLSALQALRTALRALRPGGADPTRRIVTDQLTGQDVNPMAAQIARLRLFVALQSADGAAPEPEPLPNLEARIVCADTLYTHPVSDYDPFVRGVERQADLASALLPGQLRGVLRRLAAVREMWPGDHDEAEKEARRREDQEARSLLRDVLNRFDEYLPQSAKQELYSLADYPMLELDHDEPAKIDPRLLFAQDEENWPGFDIVIGNPPYQSFSQSGIAESERRVLRGRGYRSTGAADLYTLFCEAALALARPDGGVVTVVVPLSIAFGKQQRELRRVFEEGCQSVSARHYDNIPDTIFNAHPLFKDWKNSQRTTIVTAVRGEGQAVLRTSTLLRWRTADRAGALGRRRPLFEGDVEGLPGTQWPRIPNDAVSEMVRRIASQRASVEFLSMQAAGRRDCLLSFPPTGRYFVSVVPSGVRNPNREVVLTLPDRESQLLALAALNGHCAYGWWRVFGDGFDVKLSDYADFTIPDAWLEGAGRDRALAFGRSLIDAIPESRKDKTNAKQVWPNVDFFEFQQDLITDLDRFYIDSLGLDPELLLPTLRRMRTPDGWDFA